jgi:hypothetical protein
MANLYIGFIIALGAAVLGYGLYHWEAPHIERFVWYLVLGIPAACLKVRLPGIHGSISMFFVFVLAGIVDLNLPEVLVLSLVCVAVQSAWQPLSRPRPVNIIFSAACVQVAAAATYLAFHYTPFASPVRMILAASVIFVTNTVPIAIVIALTENKPMREVWTHCYLWSFPYYLTGGAIVAALGFASPTFDWHIAILIIPALYFLYRAYTLHVNQPRTGPEHATPRTPAPGAHGMDADTRLDAAFRGSRW